MALYNIDIHNGLPLNEKHQNRMSVCSYILNTALGLWHRIHQCLPYKHIIGTWTQSQQGN